MQNRLTRGAGRRYPNDPPVRQPPHSQIRLRRRLGGHLARRRHLDPQRRRQLRCRPQPEGQGVLRGQPEPLRTRGQPQAVRYSQIHGRRMLEARLRGRRVHHVPRQSQIPVAGVGGVHVNRGVRFARFPEAPRVGGGFLQPEGGGRVGAEAELGGHGSRGVRAEPEGAEGGGGTGAEAKGARGAHGGRVRPQRDVGIAVRGGRAERGRSGGAAVVGQLGC